MHAVLEYTYEDNYLQTREKYRSDHLKAAWEAVERGKLLLGGAVGEGPFSGLLIFAPVFMSMCSSVEPAFVWMRRPLCPRSWASCSCGCG